MAKRLPKKDVVIIGLGWTGSIMANELTDEGLEVMAIERGPWRDAPTDFPPAYMQDELRYRVRHELFLRPDQLTFTFRNKMDQTALPIRSWGAFMPPNGVGGGGVHWNAEMWRFLPSDFVLKTHLTQRYGAAFLPEGMTIQDWGITYDELEPFYDRFEHLCGTSGTAGNLRGQIMEGGNPFEGPRSRAYPTPAQAQPFSHTLFGKAARELGYKPFPQPSGNLSQAYTNPLGLKMGPCTYCGFCEWFGCSNYSKASPQTTILPYLVRKPNFTARDNSEVIRINVDKSGKRATGVTFVDTSGEAWEQPAELVILSAYTLFNVQLLLHSQIGRPYDPIANTGTVGRNYSHQTVSTVNGFFDPKKFNFNPFIASGAIGMCIDEFNGDNFDHGPHGFVGGAYLGQVQTGARPIESTLVPPGTPKWGAAWKSAVKDNYLSTVKPGAGVHGSFYSYRDIYLDLDPTYTDRFGRPLMRITMDLKENEIKQNRFLTDKFAEIIKAMGAEKLDVQYRTGPYDITTYQTTHLNGGAVMGSDPNTSVINRYLQSWDVPNLFILGASAFPQNAGYNPTLTVGALAFWAAEAIRNKYLKSPGDLSMRRRMRGVITLAALLLSTASSFAGDSDPQEFTQIQRGRYLTVLSDCASCHTVPGSGNPFAGGRAIETPFGDIVAPNITPDPETGIGSWSDEAFDAAVRHGIRRNGSRLYPAMPYNAYTKMSRDDVLAIRAYLNTVTPVRNAVVADTLPFPFNIRAAMRVWDALYFKEGGYRPDPNQSAEWNRGAFLVDGPAHCGACHTPKTFLGGDKTNQYLEGADLQGWSAPDITNDARLGLGRWSKEDIVSYLKSGHNHITAATGPMGEVVTLSTTHMTDPDLNAIATYLKSLPGRTQADPAVAANEPAMVAGGAIYRDQCSACHGLDGKGVAQLFPSIAESSMVKSNDPTTSIRIVLRGARSVGTTAQPTASGMPSYGRQLNDDEVAAVLTYMRNSWGGAATPVTSEQVSKVRLDTALRPD